MFSRCRCKGSPIDSLLRPIKDLLASVTGDSFWSGYAIHVAALLLVACACWVEGQSYMLFIWHCFIVPLGDTADQKSRLDKVCFSDLEFLLKFE